MEALWPIITIAGPILLVVAVIWAIMRNRATATRSAEARADAGSRKLYAEEDRRSDI